MRIVGGSARGRNLQAPKGDRVTRPTADRVRETLFNVLGQSLDPIEVLDLYAGTGALSFEALSRGAVRATLVERDREALNYIGLNAGALGFSEQIRVMATPVERAFRTLRAEGARFPLVFADPPYAQVRLTETLAELAHGLLDTDALVVFEHARSEEAPLQAPGFVREDQRAFGDTRISLYRFA